MEIISFIGKRDFATALFKFTTQDSVTAAQVNGRAAGTKRNSVTHDPLHRIASLHDVELGIVLVLQMVGDEFVNNHGILLGTGCRPIETIASIGFLD